MIRKEFMALLKPLDEYVSTSHGVHMGPSNCGECAIAALIETIGLLVTEVEIDWEE